MTPPPTISVQMPAYNAERYVSQAVESVLAQTFADFEFIIVDDGSTDRTRSILERYAAEARCIRLISRPNTGLIGARTDALAAARGEFLAYLDADDIAMPRRFEQQVDYLRAHPSCVLVGSRAIIIDQDGHPLRSLGEAMEHDELERALLGGAGGQLLYNSSVMVRRQAVLDVGGFRHDTDPAEDLDLFLRLAEVGRLVVLDEPLVMYREHLRKVGHTRARRQGDVCRAILIEAHRRRGLEPSEAIRSLSFRPRTIGERHRTWAWWALGSGYVSTARKHARACFMQRPLSPDSWRLLYCAIRGR